MFNIKCRKLSLTWAPPWLPSGDAWWTFHDGKLFHCARGCSLTEGKESEPLFCSPDHELCSHLQPGHQYLPLHLQNNTVYKKKSVFCNMPRVTLSTKRTRMWKMSFCVHKATKPSWGLDVNITISETLMLLEDSSLSKFVIS